MALGLIAAYLVGTFPTAQLVARLAGADDPTQQGSGNPGASNVYRLAGKRAGVAVGIIDALKGLIRARPDVAALLLFEVPGPPAAHVAAARPPPRHLWRAARGASPLPLAWRHVATEQGVLDLGATARQRGRHVEGRRRRERRGLSEGRGAA